jgi:hypothetical protein
VPVRRDLPVVSDHSRSRNPPQKSPGPVPRMLR